MTVPIDIAQVVMYLAVLVIATPFLGRYIARALSAERTFPALPLGKLEQAAFQCFGISDPRDMDWKEYAKAVMLFNGLGFIVLFLLQLVQDRLPLNPQKLPSVPVDLAFNAAISFMTNTNWQSYSGETTMSYLTQMLGLTVQNFVSAGTGIAVMLALVRGITRKNTREIGNFWVDLVRSVVYVLLPLSILMTVVLVSQGVIQNLSPYTVVSTLEGAAQVLPQGPAASQVAIKQLGTNGGGFFGANSAFPFENPTPLSNFIEMLAILLVPSALVYAYGVMVGSKRQGFVLWACMLTFFVTTVGVSLAAEYQHNPLTGSSVAMEGKETRFGVASSVLWSVATTAASNGSVNASHDSLSPLAGLVAMLNIMLGEVIFGGVGAGLYGMLVFVFLTVFVSGLMVGRTPEYLGKKIEAREIKMAAVAILSPSAVILIFSAIAMVTPAGLSSISNPGPHGLSQVLYAFSSAAGNNGSAFAGLNANTPLYNVGTGIAMLIGRFAVIIPVLAIAGGLAQKKIAPQTTGTLRTDTPLFGCLLLFIIVIVGALTFFPALSFGPIIEHFLMVRGIGF